MQDPLMRLVFSGNIDDVFGDHVAALSWYRRSLPCGALIAIEERGARLLNGLIGGLAKRLVFALIIFVEAGLHSAQQIIDW